jgi:hypothetical protein
MPLKSWHYIGATADAFGAVPSPELLGKITGA